MGDNTEIGEMREPERCDREAQTMTVVSWSYWTCKGEQYCGDKAVGHSPLFPCFTGGLT